MKTNKILSILLSAAMLVSAAGIPVFADEINTVESVKYHERIVNYAELEQADGAAEFMPEIYSPEEAEFVEKLQPEPEDAFSDEYIDDEAYPQSADSDVELMSAETSGTCGDNLTWTLEDGILTISGTGKMEDYSYSSAPWNANRKDIMEVIIENGVTTIGEYAFSYCSNMTSVTIPEGIASINKCAFLSCYALKELYFPQSLSSIATGGYDRGAFYGCSGLEKIEVSEGNTQYYSVDGILFRDKALVLYPAKKVNTTYSIPKNITQIYEYAFDGCRNLTSVEIPAGVTYISSHSFYGCENLTDIELPEGLTGIGAYAFNNCSLTTINIPDSVKRIDNDAFWACDELTAVYITDLEAWCDISFDSRHSNPLTNAGNLYLNGELVTEVTIPSDSTYVKPYIFSGSTSLSKINLHNGIISIGGGAFYGCSNLTSIEIPSSVASIGGDAFSECTGLTGIYITDLEAWCNISFDYYSNPLSYAGNLYINNVLATDIAIPNSITEINDNTFDGCTSLRNVSIPNSTRIVGNSAFRGCSNLTSIEIPNSVNSIGYSSFSGCSNLTSIEIPNSVNDIGSGSFSGCSRLKNVVLGNGITSIGRTMFSNCVSLSNITIPNSVTSIGEAAFYNCSSLTKITVPSKVTSIGTNVFCGCLRLTDITVSSSNSVYSSADGVLFNKAKTELIYCPEGKGGSYSIPNNTTKICEYAFYNNKALTNVTMSDNITEIGAYAFQHCTKLTNVNMSKATTIIGDQAFLECINLTQIELPVSLTSIGYFAFQDCINLESIDIPDNVTGLGLKAFSGCEKLKSAVLGRGITCIDFGTFRDCALLETVEIKGDVTEIDGEAFYRCISLKEIDIPSGVTKISDNCFQECKSLTEIYISNNITSIGTYAFYGCNSLTTVNIPASVTSIKYDSFANCARLTDINVSENNENYLSEDGVLYNKDKTTLITFPAGKTGEYTLPASVTDIDGSIGSKLTAINVESGSDYYTSVGGVLYNKDITTLIRYPGAKEGEYTIPETVTSIESGALSGKGLTSITVLNTEALDNVYNLGSLLSGCASLSYINIGADSENYSSHDGVLFNRDKTKLICYPAGRSGEYIIPDGVSEIGYWAFYNNSNLTGVQIPESVTSIVVVKEGRRNRIKSRFLRQYQTML